MLLTGARKKNRKSEDKEMNQEVKKGNAWALLPIGVFLVIFLGAGIVSGDFYAMPAIVAFLIASPPKILT